MLRALALLLAVAGLAAAPATSGAAACSPRLVFRATSYKAVAVHGRLVPGSRVGTATLVGCRTANLPPGYAAAAGRDVTRHLSVYAVPGVRAQVAIALKSRAGTTLYVSRTTPTAAERAALARLRSG
jgi:Family of unknown function (DUF6281)